MSAIKVQHAITSDDGGWGRKLSPYRQPHTLRGLGEVAVTAIPFAALWFAIALSMPCWSFRRPGCSCASS
jgi:hypothetical protein